MDYFPGRAKGFHKLVAWQKGIELAKACYVATANFPPSERFGITAQIRRSAVSVPCNIAEGSARKTTGELLNSTSIASGEVGELETLFVLSKEFGYLTRETYFELLELTDEQGRIHNGLRVALQRSVAEQRRPRHRN